jgi:phosphoribosylformylglycinamidine synthase
MKAGVVIFPGSNCDRDIIHVLRKKLGLEVEEIWHKTDNLDHFDEGDCIVLPGGFSYGDYLRSGAIARFSPVMSSVIKFANSGGYVLGICNGFQILCESGLLPGALLRNSNQQFICRNVYITPANNDTAITASLAKGMAYKIPIAHAEGRFYADQKTLDELERNLQVVFRYCDENGEIHTRSNPNGSERNIAGICNASRNVFGLMPHPERAAEKELSNTDGLPILESFVHALQHQETDVLDNLLR